MRIEILSLCFSIASVVQAQQWSGNNNTTDPINRTGNVGIGTTTPFASTNSKGLHIAGGDHSALLLGNPIANGHGGILQTSDNRHRVFIGANLYDDPSMSWRNFQAGRGGAGISILADEGSWGTGIDFYTSKLNDQITQRMSINGDGNVGIGIAVPAFRLDVEGFGARLRNLSTNSGSYTTYRIQGPDYTHGIEIDFFGNNNMTTDLNWSYGGGPGSAAIVNVNPKPLTFATNNQGRMIIDGAGNVGIGTFNPNQKLTVNGTIYGKEVKVDLSVPGPDYVFEKGYHLPTLEDLKQYIDLHKHLPEVPSASEMEKHGINLGTMDMLLLKKIEELTLYVIELKKENEEIRKQLPEK